MLRAYLLDSSFSALSWKDEPLPIHVERIDEPDSVILHIYATHDAANAWLSSHVSDAGKPTLQIVSAQASETGRFQAVWSEGNSRLEGELWDLPSRSNLFDRHRGLIETDDLSSARVMIVGLGSVGSMVAVELAKAGVSSFVLCDPDHLERHNLVRHACDLRDLGRNKALAVADLLRRKNPYVEVEAFPFDILSLRQTFDAVLSQVDIVLVTTDTQASRHAVNQAALEANKLVLYAALRERAYSAQIMRIRPHEGPCYHCFSDILGVDIPFRPTQPDPALPYGTAVSVAQPGLSIDILPVVQMMAKLTVQQLLQGRSPALRSLDDDLRWDFYFWANRRSDEYAGWAPFESVQSFGIERWYSIEVPRNPFCPECNWDAYAERARTLPPDALINRSDPLSFAPPDSS